MSKTNLFIKAGALVSVLVISACSEPSVYDDYLAGKPLKNIWYKAGITSATNVRDRTDCEVFAAREVPQNIQIETTPVFKTPTQTSCNQIGTQTVCNTTGGQIYGGDVSSVDVNEDLRLRVAVQCMADKGYKLVNIPACPAGANLSTQRGKVFAPFSARTCYQAMPAGEIDIGNP